MILLIESVTTTYRLPSWYDTHGHFPWDQQQPHSQGRSSQPASRSYPQGEREPLLVRWSSDAASSSNSPKTIPRISIASFLYLSALFAVVFAGLGYTLNSSIHSAYHEAIRLAWNIEERYHWKQRNTWALEATKHQEIRQAWNIEEQDH